MTPKAKEDIMLQEFCQSIFDKLDKTELQYVKDAMDEWAKQQSIEFGEWKDKYFKTTYPIDRKMYTLKYYSHVEETGSTFGTHYNLPELYEIFNKIQPNQLNINY